MGNINAPIHTIHSEKINIRKFEEVATFTRGITYKKNQETSSNEINAWKVLRANNITLSLNTLNFDDIKLVSSSVKVKDEQILHKGDILICAGSGSKQHIGKVAYIYEDMNYTFGGFMGVLRCSKELNSKFLFHILTGNLFSKYLDTALNSTTINNLNAKIMNDFEFPIPPIEMQEDIVQILDKFDNLSHELEEELKARKEQYEYYKNTLLERSQNPIKQFSLGELFTFKNGLNKGKEFFGTGSPIVNFVDVYKNRKLYSTTLKGLVTVDNKEKELYNAKVGDVFFTRTSETKEEIGMASVLLDNIIDCVFSGFVLRARPKTELLLPKFCAYCFSSHAVRKEIIKYSSFTTRALTSGTKLSKIKVFVPSLEEQERIVSILDKFEELIANIEAELKARQEQYEYYRDKLLTFNETA